MAFDIWKQIKQKQFAPIYLLYGTEEFLINETKQLIVDHALNEEEHDFNYSTYDLEETSIEIALEDAETFPFMGERRVVILKNPHFLTAEKSKSKVEHNLDKLQTYIHEPAPYSIIVFEAPYEKLDERKKLTKELKKTAAIMEAKKLTEHDLKKWIRERCAFNHVQIDEVALDDMLLLAGTNLFMLTSEIDKLALFVGEGSRIDRETVDHLVARSLEQNIFSLVDKAVNRKVDEALRIYYDLLKQNEEPLKISAILAGQFRLIYQVKELSRRGYGQQQIASSLKVHPFRIKIAAGQAKYFKDEELTDIISQLANIDYQMKTGGMNKVLLIELFLLKLSGQR